MRLKLLLATFLVGFGLGYGTVRAIEQWQILQFRLDRIENFLSQGAAIQIQPQSHRESHKGEISKPRDMKV